MADSESSKRNEIYKEAIEKLTAAHVRGFEPALVLKNKILNKIQIKFDISEIIMKDLSNIFLEGKYQEEEDNLLKQRYEDQVKILEKFIKTNALVYSYNRSCGNNNVNNFISSYQKNFGGSGLNNFNSNYNKYSTREKDPDYFNIYHQNKQELKRYEKELEMKAGKGAFLMDEKEENIDDYINQDADVNDMRNIYNNYGNIITNANDSNANIFESVTSNNLLNVATKRISSSSIIEREKNYDEYRISGNMGETMPFGQPDLEFTEKFLIYNQNVKVKDILKVSDADEISKFKNKIVEGFISKINKESVINNNVNDLSNTLNASPKKTFYKSKILNDLFVINFFKTLAKTEYF